MRFRLRFESVVAQGEVMTAPPEFQTRCGAQERGVAVFVEVVAIGRRAIVVVEHGVGLSL